MPSRLLVLWFATLSLLVTSAAVVAPPAAHAATDGRIVFVSDRDGDLEIYAVNSDGSGLAQLTSNEVADSTPALSPDGRSIAFARQGPGSGSSSILLMATDGSGERALTNYTGAGNGDSAPAFSPDGTRIAFVRAQPGASEIWLMGSGGDNLVTLTSGPGQDVGPQFSPDGQRIVFGSTSRPDDVDGDIYLVDAADGGHLLNLTHRAGADRSPTFSPDGSRILFSSDRDGTADLFTMRADGSEQASLLARAEFDSEPRYSPDGSRVVFRTQAESSGANADLATADAAGRDVRVIGPAPGADFAPSWGVVAQAAPSPVATPLPTPVPPAVVAASAPAVTAADVPPPGTAGTVVAADVPDQSPGGTGAFTITTSATSAQNMGPPISGFLGGVGFLEYNVAALGAPIVITDERPGAQSWSVVGQLTNFTPSLIFGRYLGWTPVVLGSAGDNMGAVPGSIVDPGYPGFGTGLHDSRVLGMAYDGHECALPTAPLGCTPTDTTASLNAGLKLRVPTSVPAGTYTATMTFTALS